MLKFALVAGLVLASAVVCPARAEVSVVIDKSAQRMTVAVNGSVRHVWPVSTGRAGFGTPNGRFRPQTMARRWFSRKYYNSPMPYSIFFHKGYAIHGTTYIRRLGGPASHGCVRLHPSHAAALFALVGKHGMGSTRITVTGGSGARVAKRARSKTQVRPVTATAPAYVRPAAYRPGYQAPLYPRSSYGSVGLY